MLPTVEEARRELDVAAQLNPGPWIEHSINVGIAARNIAQRVPELDENKAYIVGMLHDIGRRVGIVNIPRHVYEGYRKDNAIVSAAVEAHSSPIDQSRHR
ncbi:MAG: HDOD domain-containing protein [bacterium]|nr:HDOD domain-containing protein [bacterium]MCM1376186.1 HDOD domain-containing protein [Muribaculum sp.]